MLDWVIANYCYCPSLRNSCTDAMKQPFITLHCGALAMVTVNHSILIVHRCIVVMLCIVCIFCRLDLSCSSVPVARQQSPPTLECAVHAERTCTNATSAGPSTTMRKIRFYATRVALASMPNLTCTWNTSLARQSTPSRQRRTGRRWGRGVVNGWELKRKYLLECRLLVDFCIAGCEYDYVLMNSAGGN